MDYVDWCLQAYITTVTPITYSSGFHQVVSTLLYAMVTFESLEALNTFFQSAVIYNAQAYITILYWQVVIVYINNFLSMAYEALVAISYVAFLGTIIGQTWTVWYYLIRSTLAAYTSQSISTFPEYTFPCVCTTASCIECLA